MYHYASIVMHLIMLRDRARCEAFQQALNAVVQPGQTVLDVGAGSGLLSIFAARAGAEKVYAVEISHMAQLARHFIADNGLSDRIEVLEADASEVELPGKVDLIVSEWMGTYGVDENMLPAMLDARDKYLKPGGAMMPADCTVYIAPVDNAQFHEDMEFWRGQPYGVELGRMADVLCENVQRPGRPSPASELLAPASQLWRHDCHTFSATESRQPYHGRASFEVQRAGRLNAFVLWFTSDLGGGVELSTGPEAPDTHWGRPRLPLHAPVEVAAGDVVDIEVTCLPGKGHMKSDTTWKIRVNGGDEETHDTRRGWDSEVEKAGQTWVDEK